tara:strand:+ start:5021 stop:5434 length:414 start_codon:yes stop_codon:yes gene_type:complete
MQCTSGPSRGGGKREVELVEAGWHKGKVRFSDEKPKYNKIQLTLDLDDGRRCKFNVNAAKGKEFAEKLGISTPGGVLNAVDLEDVEMEVELAQWTNEDDGNTYNTYQDVKREESKDGVSDPPVQPAPKAVKEGEIPF